MAGSLGMAAGEAVIAGILRAVEHSTPFVLFTASGGARMQEGILSLMQMPRTTIAVQRLRDAGLPFIVVLTDPTTGGVTASYAMLGDVHIAEPGALICFAGPRVIQQTIREQLPEGFQRAEYLLEHGMIDMVVHRHQLPETISRLCRLLMSKPAQKGVQKARSNAVNGRGHVNGSANTDTSSAIDVREPGSSTSDSEDVIEAQPVADAERFAANNEGSAGNGDGGSTAARGSGQTRTDRNS